MKVLSHIAWRLAAVILCIILLFATTSGIATAMFVEPWPSNASAPADCHADFVVLGDSQGSFDPLWTIAPNFDDMLGLINEIDAPMAFHVGDMYTGDTFFASDVDKQAEWFLEDMAILKMPMYPVMGNHDARGKGWDVTKEMIFQNKSTYYSFDEGDSHFIVLDAFMPEYEHSISQEQFSWLENDLKSTTKPHIFVFVHAPLYPLGPHLGESLDEDPTLRDRLASLLVKYGVDIVFNGHEHFYASFGYSGLMQVTTGGAGANLNSPEEFGDLVDEYDYAADKITRWVTHKTLHYVCVDTGTNIITVTAYDPVGNIIDQFSVPS